MGKETDGIREDVLEALKPIKIGWGSSKPVQEIAAELASDEKALRIGGAKHKGKLGYLTITDRRLLFTEIRAFARSAAISILRSSVLSAESKGTILRDLTIRTAGESYKFDNLTVEVADQIVSEISKGNHPISTTQSVSIAEQLLQLKQLLDAGVLTQAEYGAKAAPLKARL